MHDDWLQRWDEGRIGWHRDDVHPSLARYWRTSDATVLVPLCGKSRDLRWLAEQGHAVTGVELAKRAVAAFFEEQELEPTIDPGSLPAWRAKALPITLHCGDYFALEGVRFDAHYDRGALVALPAELRGTYAEHTTKLLTENAEQLVITVEYEQAIAAGPPFSVPPEEVLSYWPQLECVERREVLDEAPPKFREAGLRSVIESVWRSRPS